MNDFIRVSLLHSVAAPLNVHVENWLHGENAKTVQDTQPELQVGYRSKGPKRRHSVTQSHSQERAARREADKIARFAVQFNRDGRRNCSPGDKPTVSQQAVHSPRVQQEKQRPDEKKISVRRLLQGKVRDMTLQTMCVLSTTFVVIFVLCIDSLGFYFHDVKLPTLFSLFVLWTTGAYFELYSYVHENNSKRCLSQPSKHRTQYSWLAYDTFIGFLPAFLLVLFCRIYKW